MQKIYLIAIVFIPDGRGEFDCKKYRHNITVKYMARFCADMQKKFPAATYINFYLKNTAEFKERIYLK
jgi:hypothetical protein